MRKNLDLGQTAVRSEHVPAQFPTHRHDPHFWEQLGRVVATFGFLEEILGKAIFSFTATRAYVESEIETAYARWLPTLERALTDPLGNLIESYGRAVRDNPNSTKLNLARLLDDLRRASTIRNVLCHGSWRLPDAAGASLPLFVNKQKLVFETPIDIDYLEQLQREVAELIYEVINSVTCMGWQFPGSNGPGKPIWNPSG